MYTLLRTYTYQYLIACAFFLSHACILFSLIIWYIIRWCLNMFESSFSSLRSHFPLYHRFFEHRLNRIVDKILAISNKISLLSQHKKILQGQIILKDPHVNVVRCILKKIMTYRIPITLYHFICFWSVELKFAKLSSMKLVL